MTERLFARIAGTPTVPIHLDTVDCPKGCGHKFQAHDNDLELYEWPIEKLLSEEVLPYLGECLVGDCPCGRPKTYNIAEAAREIGCTPTTLRYAIYRGRVNTVMNNAGAREIPLKDFERFKHSWNSNPRYIKRLDEEERER